MVDGEDTRLKIQIEEISKKIDQIMKKVGPYMPSKEVQDATAETELRDGQQGSSEETGDEALSVNNLTSAQHIETEATKKPSEG